MKHQILLILHLLAATIWIGGHLFLAFRFLPEAWRKKENAILNEFRRRFEPIGMPALLVLIVTGVIMSYDYYADVSDWFSFSHPIERIISIKLILFFISVSMALFAQLYLFPRVKPKQILPVAVLVIAVTLIAVSMLVLGTFIRFGGIGL